MAGKTSGAVSGAASGAATGSAFGPWGAVAGGLLGAADSLFGSDDSGKEYDRYIDRLTRATEYGKAGRERQISRQNALTNILMKNIMSGQDVRLDQFKGSLNPIMNQITSAYEGAGEKIHEGADAAYGYRLGRPVDRGYAEPIKSRKPNMDFLKNAKLPNLQTNPRKKKVDSSSTQSFMGMKLTPDQIDVIESASAKMSETGLSELAGG